MFVVKKILHTQSQLRIVNQIPSQIHVNHRIGFNLGSHERAVHIESIDKSQARMGEKPKFRIRILKIESELVPGSVKKDAFFDFTSVFYIECPGSSINYSLL
jgi:hypothetical protein